MHGFLKPIKGFCVQFPSLHQRLLVSERERGVAPALQGVVLHTPDGSLYFGKEGGVILFVRMHFLAGIGKDVVFILSVSLGEDGA